MFVYVCVCERERGLAVPQARPSRGHARRPSPSPVSAFRVQGLGFGVLGLGVWGLGFGVWGLGFGVWGLGFGVLGLGFGVWGLGFGVGGLEFRSFVQGFGLRGLTRSHAMTVASRCAIVSTWTQRGVVRLGLITYYR